MRIFVSLMPIKNDEIEHWMGILSDCVDGFHIDVMDGIFVPHTHGSLDLISRVMSLTNLPVWIHLMVSYSRPYVSSLNVRSGDIVSLHYEAFSTASELRHELHELREKGAYASLAINPETPVESVAPYVPCLDQVLLMGVAPGKSGQMMLPSTKSRMQELHHLRIDTQAKFTIGLDGGITPQSLDELNPYMPDDSAAASSIVFVPNPCGAVLELKGIAEQGG